MSKAGTPPENGSDGLRAGDRWSAVHRRSVVQRRTAEDDDLQAGLDNLSRLGSAQLGLEELLTRVAGCAVQSIPGAEGAGLTLLEEDRADTIVATTSFVRDIDDIQYALGQGPCITAAREGQTIMSGSLGEDPRWREFGRRIADMGVHSVLSLPLTTNEVVGAMNIYSHDHDVFDDRAAVVGEVFSVPAAVAVQNAQVLAQARRLAAALQEALNSRAVIDRAVGIVMSRHGGTAEQARAQLAAQRSGRQHLVDVAEQVVQEAVSRAKRRRPPQPNS